MNPRTHIDPQAPRSSFLVAYGPAPLTLDAFLDRISSSYRRSGALDAPECILLAVRGLRAEFRAIGLPLTHQQARSLLNGSSL